MAQTNFTPILTYKSDTASSVPSAGNLTNSANGAELAVNTADKRLFTKDSGGNVVEVGTNPSSMTLPNGSANGVLYLNGSKVLTSGSALTFDGTNFFGGTNTYVTGRFYAQRSSSSLNLPIAGYTDGSAGAVLTGAKGDIVAFGNAGGDGVIFANSNTEQMRLTSTGLGIGTSSPLSKLDIKFATDKHALFLASSSYSNGADLIATNDTGSEIALGLGGNTVRFYTTATERMRLDSSGNLGLGVTPSAWYSSFGTKVFQFAGSGVLYGLDVSNSDRRVILQNNAYVNASSGNEIYLNTGAATKFLQSAGAHSWYTAASGTAGDAISFTQAMTLDANGQLGIGVTSPSATLHVTTGNATVGLFATSRASGGYIQYTLGASGTSIGYMGSAGQLSTTGGTNDFSLRAENNLLFNAGGNVERARIDSSGNLLVGTTSANGRIASQSATDTNGSYALFLTNSATTNMFYVRGDGVVMTGAAAASPYNNTTASAANMYVDSGGILYRSTSSLKYKTDVQNATHGLAEVLALRPVTYKGKNDGDTVFGGLIAEEVHAAGLTEFVQYADDGTPDALAYGQMVSLCIKAIQELKAEFDAYKASHP